MISTVLAMALATTAAQNDATRVPREAFQLCLRQFMNRHIESRTAVAEFQTALTQQCNSEAAAYRAAVMQRETSFRASRANAERAAEEALGEARTTFLERYRMMTEPQ